MLKNEYFSNLDWFSWFMKSKITKNHHHFFELEYPVFLAHETDLPWLQVHDCLLLPPFSIPTIPCRRYISVVVPNGTTSDADTIP